MKKIFEKYKVRWTFLYKAMFPNLIFHLIKKLLKMKKSFGVMAPQILHTCKIKKFNLQSKLKLTAYFLLNWDTLWQYLWESCSYIYLVCRYLSRTISLDYVCIINELTMCPQLWSYLLMNNANSLQGVSWSNLDASNWKLLWNFNPKMLHSIAMCAAIFGFLPSLIKPWPCQLWSWLGKA